MEASRLRLLRAEDEGRQRLAERLDRRPGQELAEVERLVGEVRPGVNARRVLAVLAFLRSPGGGADS